jgi:dCMP deaminase
MSSWTNFYMDHAKAAAKKSKDSTAVGAALVNEHGSVILTSFNGPPRGVKDLPERRERPLKYLYAAHSEQNLISFAARHGIKTDGCCVAITHFCCSNCAKILIQAGIKHIIYGSGQTNMPEEEFIAARQMLFEAGVTTEEYHGSD